MYNPSLEQNWEDIIIVLKKINWCFFTLVFGATVSCKLYGPCLQVWQSVERGQWLGEEPFEMSDHFPSARLYRLERQGTGMLYKPKLFSPAGSIFVSSSCTNPPAQQLERLLTLTGGKVAGIKWYTCRVLFWGMPPIISTWPSVSLYRTHLANILIVLLLSSLHMCGYHSDQCTRVGVLFWRPFTNRSCACTNVGQVTGSQRKADVCVGGKSWNTEVKSVTEQWILGQYVHVTVTTPLPVYILQYYCLLTIIA